VPETSAAEAPAAEVPVADVPAANVPVEENGKTPPRDTPESPAP
jgi:hypothetical protein